jgi:hypothetical protein
MSNRDAETQADETRAGRHRSPLLSHTGSLHVRHFIFAGLDEWEWGECPCRVEVEESAIAMRPPDWLILARVARTQNDIRLDRPNDRSVSELPCQSGER